MEHNKLVETVKSAQNGDENALGTLYHNYAKSVYYLALKRLKNKEDAEDITQEVFINVFRRITELREAEAFPAWLNRITANKCTDMFKKKKELIESYVNDLEIMDFSAAKILQM